MSSTFTTRYNERKTTKQAKIQLRKLVEQTVEICHIMTQMSMLLCKKWKYAVINFLPDLILILDFSSCNLL